MKKLFFLFVLFFLFGNFVSGVVQNYYVTPNPSLDSLLTVYGESDSNGFCALLIFDTNNDFVYRLTDPIITNGVFVSSYYKVSEGDKLFRGFDYNVTATCPDGTATLPFTVGQRNTIAFPIQQEVDFITSPGNLNPVFFYGAIIAILLIALTILLYFKRNAKKLSRFS